MEGDHGVLIGDGRSSVRLTRAGPPNELGYPTIIDIHAGPFRGSVRDNLIDYGSFRLQLAALYESLRGSAKLCSYEGFELDIIGNGRGELNVPVRVVGDPVPLIMLKFELRIDQSYLPAIIRQIDAEFPPPYRDFAT